MRLAGRAAFGFLALNGHRCRIELMQCRSVRQIANSSRAESPSYETEAFAPKPAQHQVGGG
jgi:hypothetical protein